MNIDEYQAKAMETAIYPDAVRVVYPILGLLGEAAELAAKVRDAIFPEGREMLGYEERLLWDTITDCVQSGGFAEKLKKFYRDDPDVHLARGFGESLAKRVADAMPVLQSMSMQREAADPPWYLAASYRDMGFSMSHILQVGLDKLAARKQANTLKGSGDDR